MLILRPRQQEMTDKAKTALMEHGNTLCVAPTGAGKTIMLSSVIKDHLKQGEKCLVLQHTDEILDQNRAKFERIDSSCKLSLVNGKIKDFSGDVIFSMVQSLQRDKTLLSMPKIDFLVIDEAHHSVAPTYERILTQAKAKNPSLRILGMTATPTRADKHGLAKVFSNVADQITIEELVASGDLLYPKTFVIETDTQEKIREILQKTKKYRSDEEDNFDEAEETLMEIDQSDIIRHWRSKAEGRKTIVFCHRVDYSKRVAEAFNATGIKAVHVDGSFNRETRQTILEEFTQGDTKVICNVSVLTEGWDYPPTSCVVLLRAFSSQPAMVQMIGRGLRTIDPSLYPDCAKIDCIVLDFGLSVSHHGSIESKVDLLPKKKCPACKAWIPHVAPKCPKCGLDFVQRERIKAEKAKVREQKRIQRLKDIEMQEMELERRRKKDQEYHQSTLRDGKPKSHTIVFSKVDESEWMASGSEGYAVIKQLEQNSYSLLMKSTQKEEVYLGTAQECAQIGSDFLKQNGGDFLPFDDSSWGALAPTRTQLGILYSCKKIPQTRRQAAAMISYKLCKDKISKAYEKIMIEQRRVAMNPMQRSLEISHEN